MQSSDGIFNLINYYIAQIDVVKLPFEHRYQLKLSRVRYRLNSFSLNEWVTHLFQFLYQRSHGLAEDWLENVSLNLKEGFQFFLLCRTIFDKDIFQVEQIYFFLFSLHVEFAKFGVTFDLGWSLALGLSS